MGTEKQTQIHDKVFWHGAFTHASQLELCRYKDSLTFIDEHQLSKEALIIDLVVIKKESGVKIEKNIGRIFLGHNVIEFKSEKDSLTVRDYGKVLGYTHLYSSFTPADILDMTVTFVVTVHPRDLLAYLENDRKLGINYDGAGIYHVSGEALPVQIIEAKKLPRAENPFITMLHSSMDAKEANEAIVALREADALDSKNPLFDRIVRANRKAFEEAKAMSAEAKEILMGTTERLGWLEELKKNEAKEITREIARGFKKDNVPIQVIEKNTGLTAKEIEAL